MGWYECEGYVEIDGRLYSYSGVPSLDWRIGVLHIHPHPPDDCPSTIVLPGEELSRCTSVRVDGSHLDFCGRHVPKKLLMRGIHVLRNLYGGGFGWKAIYDSITTPWVPGCPKPYVSGGLVGVYMGPYLVLLHYPSVP